MDSSDINTRLPPRKRLLAGLKKDNSDSEFPLQIPAISGKLCDRLRDVVNSPNSSPEEIIEASTSVALAASEIAATARATAMEKFVVATKAKAAARSALELLDSVAKEARRQGCPAKNKLKKKHVQIKLLYESNQPLESHETDEELARRLHRAMNSSPRISNSSHKRRGTSQRLEVSDGHDMCNRDLPALDDGDSMLINENSVFKLGEKISTSSNVELLGRKRESSNTIEKQHHGSKARGIAVSKKSKVKQKKLPLSQCNIREQGKPYELPVPIATPLTRATKLDYAERHMPLTDGKPLSNTEVSMKITSLWKCKKFKVSRCYSDGKVLLKSFD